MEGCALIEFRRGFAPKRFFSTIPVRLYYIARLFVSIHFIVAEVQHIVLCTESFRLRDQGHVFTRSARHTGLSFR